MSYFMRTLCKIAIPVTLQGMLQASFSIVDQIMIGQLGEAGIAAVGLCSNFTLIFSVMSGAVGTVAGILIAQFLGAEEHTEAWRSLDVSLVCGGVLAALFLLTAGGFPAQVLGLYTADDAILRVGAGYFRIVAFSYLPMAVSTVLSAWLRCKEHAAVPFWASFGAVAANTGLNYLLIFGKHDKHILLIHVQPAFDQRAAPTLRIGDFTGRRRQQGVDFTQHFRIVIRCGRYDHHVIRR